MLSNRFASQVTEIDADNRREPITAGEGGLVTTVRPVPSTSHTFTSDPENNVGFDLVLHPTVKHLHLFRDDGMFREKGLSSETALEGKICYCHYRYII